MQLWAPEAECDAEVEDIVVAGALQDDGGDLGMRRRVGGKKKKKRGRRGRGVNLEEARNAGASDEIEPHLRKHVVQIQGGVGYDVKGRQVDQNEAAAEVESSDFNACAVKRCVCVFDYDLSAGIGDVDAGEGEEALELD